MRDAARRLKLAECAESDRHSKHRNNARRDRRAALGALPPVTVRPHGDPFSRQVSLPEDPCWTASSTSSLSMKGRDCPGVRSEPSPAGWSSMACPSSASPSSQAIPADPGPEASEEDRQRWEHSQRVAAELDPHWLVSRLGPLERLHRGEQLKFLAGEGHDRFLLKFTGLGPVASGSLRWRRHYIRRDSAPSPWACSMASWPKGGTTSAPARSRGSAGHRNRTLHRDACEPVSGGGRKRSAARRTRANGKAQRLAGRSERTDGGLSAGSSCIAPPP